MNSSIDPYLITKNILPKVFSFKFQNIMLASLLIIYGYSKFFGDNLKQFTDIISKVVPNEAKDILHTLLVPTLNFTYFIGFVGILLMLVLLIMLHINEKKGWFTSALSNYSYYFRNGKAGIFDNMAEKLIVLPINCGIILSGICYFLNESLIVKYYENPSFVLLSPYVVLFFYLGMAVSFFMQKIES